MDQNEGAVEAAQEVEAIEAEVETLEGETPETKETTDWKAKFEEVSGRLKRAETKLEKSKIDKKVEVKLQKKQDELDETALDYLDLKGITESEDIKIIEDIVKKTGMSVRQALKDDYVISKLAANKTSREVKEAMPSTTKRGSGNQGTDLAVAIAKYEESGYRELPKDFALRSAVINAVAKKQDPNQPHWHRN